MGILIIAAALLSLGGLIGTVAVFAIPSWRPRGPRKNATITRLVVFLACLVIGAAIIVYAAQSTTTIVLD